MAPLAFAPSAAAAAGGWSFPHGGLVALHGQPGMMVAAPAVLPLLGMVGMVSKACKEGKAAGRNGGKPARLFQRQATNREAQKRYRRGCATGRGRGLPGACLWCSGACGQREAACA